MNKKRLLTLMGGSPLNFTQPTYKGEKVYGVTWTKADVPLVRTNSSIGMVAAAGVDAGTVTNNFDTADIYSEFTEVTDADSNVFIRIPKFYIRKTDIAGFKSWQISKAKLPNSYIPWCFYNFTTSTYNDYIYVGKYVAGNSGTDLTSVANVYPTVLQNIATFRTWATNVGAGYQQLDIHIVDMLQVLFTVEFATLDSQSIMAGWSAGNYNTTDLLTADTSAANTIVVANAVGAQYAIGQPVALGSSRGNNSVFYGRNITNIQVDTPGAGSTTITVDGGAFNASTGNVLYNVGWKSGATSGVAATSGSVTSNSTGKQPFHYRGIENLYGNVFQIVDGYNINNNQGWFCKNAEQYVSNVFASPYLQLGYVNASTSGTFKYMGFDSSNPMIEIPTDITADYYKDYYSQFTGQRIAYLGGRWYIGTQAGIFSLNLLDATTSTSVTVGGRLCTKAVSV